MQFDFQLFFPVTDEHILQQKNKNLYDCDYYDKKPAQIYINPTKFKVSNYKL